MNLQALLDKYSVDVEIDTLLTKWQEPQRHYHDQTHLNDLINQIEVLYKKNKISKDEEEKLLLTAIFHDIIYQPTRKDNEEKSAEYFISLCKHPDNPNIHDIKQAILDTKHHQSKQPFSKLFNQLDMDIVTRPFEELLEWEKGCYEEYKVYGETLYKHGRLEFLKTLPKQYPQNKENLKQLIEWVKKHY